MEHALHLLILILATRFLGEVFERLGQPASIGEIVTGVLLAVVATSPYAHPLISNLPQSPFLESAAEYGIFFLLLFAGIEMQPRELMSGSTKSLAIALGGAIVPLVSGFLLAWLFLPDTPAKLAQASLVGVALSISAIPVSVRVLHELGLLHTAVGNTIVSAAILDDLIGIFLMAFVLGIVETGTFLGPQQIAVLTGNVVVFFGVTVLVGMYVTPRMLLAIRSSRIPEPEISALMIVAFGFSFLAEFLELSFILGPIMAGLFFDPGRAGEATYKRVKESVKMATDGLLAPLFFASIGARMDLGAFTAIPVFLSALLLVAILGKLLGAGLPARATGFSTRDSVAIGVGLNGRGAVELIIASIALEAGIFDNTDPAISSLFSALVIVAVVTTLLTPLGLRMTMGKKQ